MRFAHAFAATSFAKDIHIVSVARSCTRNREKKPACVHISHLDPPSSTRHALSHTNRCTVPPPSTLCTTHASLYVNAISTNEVPFVLFTTRASKNPAKYHTNARIREVLVWREWHSSVRAYDTCRQNESQICPCIQLMRHSQVEHRGIINTDCGAHTGPLDELKMASFEGAQPPPPLPLTDACIAARRHASPRAALFHTNGLDMRIVGTMPHTPLRSASSRVGKRDESHRSRSHHPIGRIFDA